MKASKGKFHLTTVALAIAATGTVFTAQAQEFTSEEKMVVVSSRTPKAISDIIVRFGISNQKPSNKNTAEVKA